MDLRRRRPGRAPMARRAARRLVRAPPVRNHRPAGRAGRIVHRVAAGCERGVGGRSAALAAGLARNSRPGRSTSDGSRNRSSAVWATSVAASSDGLVGAWPAGGVAELDRVAGVGTSEIARSGWIVGHGPRDVGHVGRARTSRPAPWSTMPYASAFATHRSAIGPVVLHRARAARELDLDRARPRRSPPPRTARGSGAFMTS